MDLDIWDCSGRDKLVSAKTIPKNLCPSYKMDHYIWDCFWEGKNLIIKEITSLVKMNIFLPVCMTDQFMVAAFPDKSRVDYIYFCKRPPYGEALKKIDKLSAWEPKVSHCVLICLYNRFTSTTVFGCKTGYSSV